MKNKKEIINYIIFGVLTTLINIASYAILAKALHIDYKISTTIAWILSVLFAFITNKFYVFNSSFKDIASTLKEFISFVFFRLLSYGIDLLTMVIFIENLHINDLITKIIANIIVIIFNYVASKLFIFKSRN